MHMDHSFGFLGTNGQGFLWEGDKGSSMSGGMRQDIAQVLLRWAIGVKCIDQLSQFGTVQKGPQVCNIGYMRDMQAPWGM